MQAVSGEVYQIGLSLNEPTVLLIGRKRFILDSGFYVYTGRSKIHIEKRIQRHLNRGKIVKRWHVDYLTTHFAVGSIHSRRFPLSADQECILNQTMRQSAGFVEYIEQFGSSDCKNGCIGHLAKLKNEKYWQELYENYSDH